MTPRPMPSAMENVSGMAMTVMIAAADSVMSLQSRSMSGRAIRHAT